jgi:hypothetical protein
MTQFQPIRLPSDDGAESVPMPKNPLAQALSSGAEPTHLVHFEPLSAQSAEFDISCDPRRRVGLDALGDRLRNDYFFARALIGRLFARPTVRQALPLMHA